MSRNYRSYFIGQAISLCGSWMQTVALGWLVLQLTGSGTILGFVTAIQFSPVFFLSLWGGVIADRFSKHKLLYFTQSAYCILALILGIIIAIESIELWMVYIFALFWGLINIVDNPARHSFMAEIVDKEQLPNVVSVNSIQVNLTRVIGPAIGIVLINKLGLAACFIANAISFAAIIIALSLISPNNIDISSNKKAKGMIKEGLNYIKITPSLSHTLLMVFIVGTLTYEFPVTLPLLAKFTFGGEADLYATMTVVLGSGSVFGGIFAAANSRNISFDRLALAALYLSMGMFLISIAPTLEIALLSIFIAGALSVNFFSLANAILHQQCNFKMRGRVMSLWSMAVVGSTLIGGPIVGWISEYSNPKWGLAVGGIASLVAAGFGWIFKKQ